MDRRHRGAQRTLFCRHRASQIRLAADQPRRCAGRHDRRARSRIHLQPQLRKRHLRCGRGWRCVGRRGHREHVQPTTHVVHEPRRRRRRELVGLGGRFRRALPYPCQRPAAHLCGVGGRLDGQRCAGSLFRELPRQRRRRHRKGFPAHQRWHRPLHGRRRFPCGQSAQQCVRHGRPNPRHGWRRRFGHREEHHPLQRIPMEFPGGHRAVQRRHGQLPDVAKPRAKRVTVHV